MRSVKFVEAEIILETENLKEKRMMLSSKMVNRTHIMRPIKTLLLFKYSKFFTERQADWEFF